MPAVAYRLGDATAKLFGRLTLNPIVHFDPLGGLLRSSRSCSPGSSSAGPSRRPSTRRTSATAATARCWSPWPVRLELPDGARRRLHLRVLDAAGVDLIGTMIGLVLYLFVLYNVAAGDLQLHPRAAPRRVGAAVPVLTPRQAWQVRPFLTQYGIFVRPRGRPRSRAARSSNAHRTLGSTNVAGGRVRPASSARTCSRACAPRNAPRWRRGCGPRSWRCSTRCTSPTGATGSTSSPRCGGPA